jgi:hypothetical protein
MGIRYKIDSNGKNLFTERTYYKKGTDFFIVEESKKEFKILTSEPPKVNFEQSIKFYDLSEYKDISSTSITNKIIFSSGISKVDQKVIRKIFKEWDQDKLPKLGWKFFDKSTKIFGESEVINTPYNKLDFYGYITEVSSISITKEQFEKYSTQGIDESEIDWDQIFNTECTGFSNPYCELLINGTTYNIEKQLEKLIKLNTKKIENYFPKLEIVRESLYKGGQFSLEIYEEFDPKKFNIYVENYVIGKNAKSPNLLFHPSYDDEIFEFEDGGWGKGDDWSLVDDKGKVYGLSFNHEDFDEEFEDDEE